MWICDDHVLRAEKTDPIVKPLMALPLEDAADYEKFGSTVARVLNRGEVRELLGCASLDTLTCLVSEPGS